jgi:hypothetical protein
MKLALPIIAALLLISPLSATDSHKEITSVPGNEVGRFQIIQTVVDGSSDGSVVKQTHVLRIDTITGRTWKSVMYVSKGKYTEGWVEISVI